MSLHPATTFGAVRLTVADGERVRSFYEKALGLRRVEGAGDGLRLGAAGEAIVELVPSPDALPSPRSSTGLFHLAILVPDRIELGRAARRLSEAGWPLSGVADHLVSEALYLDDPEGNGVEIYRDRPRAEWSYTDGALEMATLPLDLGGLVEAAEGELAAEIAAGTRVGHVHLKVSGLAPAEAFYTDVLGFDVTVRGYRGALFLSAGGYHHHIGLNTWTSRGAAPPPAGSRGLRRVEVVLASSAELEQLRARAAAHGIEARQRAGRLHLSDPSGNRFVLRAPASDAG